MEEKEPSKSVEKAEVERVSDAGTILPSPPPSTSISPCIQVILEVSLVRTQCALNLYQT